MTCCRAMRATVAKAAPTRRPTRPLLMGICSVPGCESELLCRGLCFRHERAWRRVKLEPLEDFVARADPLPRLADCAVAGCGREHVSRRGLCRSEEHTSEL